MWRLFLLKTASLFLSFLVSIALLLPTSLALAQELAIAEGFSTPHEAGPELRLLETGRKAFLENHQDEASRIFTELLSINPNQVEALYRLAIINFQNKNYVDGMGYIQRAVELEPQNSMLRLARAKALEEIGRIDEAISEYQYVLAQTGWPPESPAVARADRSLGLLLLGRAEAQRDQGAVLEIGNELRGKYPTDAQLLHVVGSTFVRAGLLDEAERSYQSLVALVPENPLAYFYLANVYETMRNADMAESNFQLALQKGANNELAQQINIKLGLIHGFKLLQGGNNELALQAFLEVQKLDPMNIVVNGNIARLSQAAGRFDVAIDAFERMLKIDPGNLEAHFRIGLLHLDARRPLEAIEELDYVLANDRDGQMTAMVNDVYARLDQQLGGRLQGIRKLSADKRALVARVEQSPDDAAARVDLGNILQAQGKLPEAKEQFLKAVQTDPLLGMAYVRLGEIAERENDLGLAVDYYQRALAAMSEDDVKALEIQKRLLVTLGKHHAREGRLEEAFTAFSNVETQFGGDLEVFWNLALVASRQANTAVAKAYYNKLLDLDPTYMAARFNIGLLLEQEEDEEQAIVEYRKVLVSNTEDKRLLGAAAERIKQVQRTINGLSYSIGYSVGFDDNANVGYTNKLFEYRTQTLANLTYNYKIKKGLQFSFRFNPDYTVYHVAGYDFFTLSMTPSLAFKWREQQWSLGLNRASQSSVLRPNQSGTTTDTLFGSVGWQGTGTNYQSNFSYRGFGSQQNPFFDASTYTVGISANIMGEHGMPLSYGYTLSINQNLKRQGNDYAYVNHAVNGRVDKLLADNWSGYLNGNMALYLYSNPDSYTNFQKKRVNVSLGLGAGVNYRYSPTLSFSGSYDYTIQRSNLPLGFIYNQLQVIEGIQSSSLGSYVRSGVNFSVRYSF